MKISPITTEKRNTFIQKRNDKFVSVPQVSTYSKISNSYYFPNFQPSFTGISKIESNVVKKVLGSEYIGRGIFTKSGNYIDCNKIGTDFLAKENFDIVKSTDDEITAYRYSLAWAEMYARGKHGGGTDWVQKYNPSNRHSPLAVSHSLNSESQKKLFALNRKLLTNKAFSKSLDAPIFDENGNMFDRIIFDTETTGTTQDASIIQLASIVIKKGKVFKPFNELVNPKRPIPEEATAVNGITDEMVKDKPTIFEILKDFLHNDMVKRNGVIVAYNAKYDTTILNKVIRLWRTLNPKELESDAENRVMKQKDLYKVLDPFILIQRIHPFLGAKKKLTSIYQWLFCKNMEGAHDAFVDDKGADDVLKYCVNYINEHRVDKSKQLTIRDVLLFQNGDLGLMDKIDIPLHSKKRFNNKMNFNTSYRYLSLNVDNYFDGYKITRDTLKEIEPEIGKENVMKILENNIVEQKVDLMHNGFSQGPAETRKIPKTDKFENEYYTMEKNMKKVIGFADLEAYNGKSKEEIESLVLEKSECYLHNKNIQRWIKNVNPEDIKDGNDLPDNKIARIVMKERQEQDSQLQAT